MSQSDTLNEVRSSDRLGLLPEREGQPRTLTMALPWEYERGHWYSPAAVREMLAAERQRLITRLRQIGMYECGCAQDAQHCEELADQLAMEHTGADWPDRRQAPAVGGPVELEVGPRAWMRRWYFDGETPRKERNEKGRMAYPVKFKFLAVTPNQIFADDVPLYTRPESA